MVNRVKGSAIADLDIDGWVSLGDIGDPTGVVNCTVAFLAALTAGYAVKIPSGTFLISSITFPAGSVVFGEGEKSILKIRDLNNGVGISLAGTCKLRNFKIDGNKLNQVGTGWHAIEINGTSHNEIVGVSISNCKGSGVNLKGANTYNRVFRTSATGYTESGFRVEQGTDAMFSGCSAITSDAAASGDGFAIASNGAAVTGVILNDCLAAANVGRGFALTGNGSKNVTSCVLSACSSKSNTSNGFYLLNVDGAVLNSVVAVSNGIDGVRIEGDVQNCRIVCPITRGNTSFGIREVTAGSTPNFNGLIYSVVSGNGNNTITKVGASSYIV